MLNLEGDIEAFECDAHTVSTTPDWINSEILWHASNWCNDQRQMGTEQTPDPKVGGMLTLCSPTAGRRPQVPA